MWNLCDMPFPDDLDPGDEVCVPKRFAELTGQSYSAVKKQIQQGRLDKFLLYQPGRVKPVINLKAFAKDCEARWEALRRRMWIKSRRDPCRTETEYNALSKDEFEAYILATGELGKKQFALRQRNIRSWLRARGL